MPREARARNRKRAAPGTADARARERPNGRQRLYISGVNESPLRPRVMIGGDRFDQSRPEGAEGLCADDVTRVRARASSHAHTLARPTLARPSRPVDDVHRIALRSLQPSRADAVLPRGAHRDARVFRGEMSRHVVIVDTDSSRARATRDDA